MELRLCLVPSKILGKEKKSNMEIHLPKFGEHEKCEEKNTKAKIVIFFLLFSLKINEESKRENYFP